MSENLKNIELIELYLEGKLSENESLSFKNRLLIDEDLTEELELYKQTISLIKENSTCLLQEELNLLDEQLDKDLTIEAPKTENIKKYSIKKLIGIAASLLLVASLGLYVFSTSENEELFNQYYIKDNGLPVTMSASNNSLNTVMNFYKLGNIEEAYTEINKFEENDTILFYKAAVLIELKQYNKANTFLNNISEVSAFKQKAQYYYALSLLQENNKEKCKKALQTIVNTKRHKYSEQANQLLNEAFFQNK